MATRCQAVLRPYAELVDVEAVIAGSQAGNFAMDVHCSVGLREGDVPLHLARLGGQEDRDGLERRLRLLLFFFFFFFFFLKYFSPGCLGFPSSIEGG